MKKIILLSLALLLTYSVQAQKTPEQQVTEFFETYETQSDEAIQTLLSNKWISESDVNELLTLHSNAMANLGKYYGFEKIAEKKTANSLIFYYYLVKYERQPIRFIIKFYKPDKEWLAYSFFYDDNLEEDID